MYYSFSTYSLYPNLSLDSPPDAFKSIEGRKTVNVLLCDQDDQFLQPSKIIVNVPKNETAARAGLLFLLDSDNLSKKNFLTGKASLTHGQ